MKFQIKHLTLIVVLMTGCTLGEVIEDKARVNLPSEMKYEGTKGGQLGVSEAAAWIPLGLSRDSYLVAEKRLTKLVKIGMARREFLSAMKINPALGTEWAGRITAGEGWFSELSRKNKIGNLVVEEFTFGYYNNYRLQEKFAVIVENDRVTRIFRSDRVAPDRYPHLPQKIFSDSLDLKKENQLLKSFYQKNLQTREAFEKIVPQLRRIRAGWTSAELRIALGGGLYRMPNGLVYLQKGLLWDDGFLENGNGTNSVVILPFGYRDEKGKVHKKVIVRAEGGLVTAVFWQSDSIQGASLKER